MQQEQQQISNSLLKRLAALAVEQYPNTIKNYQYLHQCPQIGNQQHQTSKYVRQQLSKISGVTIEPEIPELPTAIIVTITPQHYDLTILLRCELDALGFSEKSGLFFASSNGLHHACGHDGHTSALISTVKIVAKEVASLQKKVIFCFQPGQEGKRGAYKLFKYRPSLTDKVDHCYAIHFHNAIKPGQIKIQPGPVTALSNRFTITIKGKSAHCLAPNAGVDANYIGCTLVSQLYALSAQTIAPMEGNSLVVVKVDGGSTVAQVSDNFTIIGSLRTFSVQSYNNLKNKIENLAKNLSEAWGATASVQFNEVNYRPVINDSSLVNFLRNKILRQGQIQIVPEQRCFAGEDFCEFSERKPSCYINVGSALQGSIDETSGESKYPAHSPMHKIDENALLWALKVWLLVVFDF